MWGNVNKTADVFVDTGVSCCVYVGISVFKDLRNIFNTTAESCSLSLRRPVSLSLSKKTITGQNNNKKLQRGKENNNTNYKLENIKHYGDCYWSAKSPFNECLNFLTMMLIISFVALEPPHCALCFFHLMQEISDITGCCASCLTVKQEEMCCNCKACSLR